MAGRNLDEAMLRMEKKSMQFVVEFLLLETRRTLDKSTRKPKYSSCSQNSVSVNVIFFDLLSFFSHDFLQRKKSVPKE